jgi:predicted acylesterase/phospholipase RssA
VLAVSGGAAYGAFGAGLLAGWTESRIRPEFRIVTGISTEAIIAPFAFLGNSYDNELKELYTQHSTKDIMRKKRTITDILWQFPCQQPSFRAAYRAPF